MKKLAFERVIKCRDYMTIKKSNSWKDNKRGKDKKIFVFFYIKKER